MEILDKNAAFFVKEFFYNTLNERSSFIYNGRYSDLKL